MGSPTSTPPKPWVQHTVGTQFLRVPTVDWAKIRLGHKSEFRSPRKALAQVTRALTPTPVVAYKVSNARTDHESQLMILERTWREPLGAISEESLEREGYPDVPHFRRYWMERHRTPRFDYLTEVQVFRIRPWVDGDFDTMAAVVLCRLYGEHLSQVVDSSL